MSRHKTDGRRRDNVQGRWRERIRVVVRIRPFMKDEDSSTSLLTSYGRNSVDFNFGEPTCDENGHQNRKEERQAFTFDRVFTEPTSSIDVYDSLITRKQPLASDTLVRNSMIDNVLDGVHGCILAYGPTSAGKTYNIFGGSQRETEPGILPLVLEDLFSTIDGSQLKDDMEKEYLVRCSYLEIYNEKISDLFARINPQEGRTPRGRRSPRKRHSLSGQTGAVCRSSIQNPASSPSSELQVKEHPLKGFVIDGLKETIVTSPDEVLDMLRKVEKEKRVAATRWNEKSSRAHVLFTIFVESTRGECGNLETISGKLHIVDLAGSEPLQKTESIRQQQKVSEEGRNINKSLFFLSEVISKLAESETTRSHIPYRDSKLTRILASAFGGNALTSLLICLSPSIDLAPQSLAALRFGHKAKIITNTIIPREISYEKSVILKQKEIIGTLKSQLESLESQASARPSPENGSPIASAHQLKANLESQIHEASRNILRSGSLTKLDSPLRGSPRRRSVVSEPAICAELEFTALAQHLHGDFGHVQDVAQSALVRPSTADASQADASTWSHCHAAQRAEAVPHNVRVKTQGAQVEHETQTDICEQEWAEERRCLREELATLRIAQAELENQDRRERINLKVARDQIATDERLETRQTDEINELQSQLALVREEHDEEMGQLAVEKRRNSEKHDATAQEWAERFAVLEATTQELGAAHVEAYEESASHWESQAEVYAGDALRWQEAHEALTEQWVAMEEAYACREQQWTMESVELCEMHKAEQEQLSVALHGAGEIYQSQAMDREEQWQAELQGQAHEAECNLRAALSATREDALLDQRAHLARFQSKLRDVEEGHKRALRIVEDKHTREDTALRLNLDVANRLHVARVKNLEEESAKSKQQCEADREHAETEFSQLATSHDATMGSLVRESEEAMLACEEACRCRMVAMEDECVFNVEAMKKLMREERHKALILEGRCAAWTREQNTLRNEASELKQQAMRDSSLREQAVHRLAHVESTLALERQIRRSADDDAFEGELLERVERKFKNGPRISSSSPKRNINSNKFPVPSSVKQAYTSHMRAYCRNLSREPRF